jgi:hypothetical protein
MAAELSLSILELEQKIAICAKEEASRWEKVDAATEELAKPEVIADEKALAHWRAVAASNMSTANQKGEKEKSLIEERMILIRRLDRQISKAFSTFLGLLEII